MRDATLCILIRPGTGDRDDRVLLGRKKRGFGHGKLNGFGGKVRVDETVREAARRELREESGLEALELVPAGRLTFVFRARPAWNQTVHVFRVPAWRGTPRETSEMAPAWYRVADIPWDEMWADDRYWLPRVLEGESVEARFTFAVDGETIESMEVHPASAAA